MAPGVETNLVAADVAIIVSYFVLVLLVGLFATFTTERGSVRGYFWAGKSMSFLPIAGSIFATNIGAPSFVGLAGSGAANGFPPIMFEWHATYMLILLGWLFVPIYIASGTGTMPEYLKKRFGGRRLRVYYAFIQLIMALLSGISGELYAGAVFIHQVLGWDLYLSTIGVLAVTAVYTIGGGLAAVMYTDTLQAAILILGACSVTGLSLHHVGGYEAMTSRFKDAAANTTLYTQATHGNMTCGFPPPRPFNIFQHAQSRCYPWPGLVFGLTPIAIYYFCTNQLIVQRNLAAKNVSHSKAACVVASFLKLLTFFMFVWPGMISRILYPEEIACTDPDVCMEVCGNRNGCTNIAYPILVLRILPDGMRGLMLAALLAALMSSLTSWFNSTSSVFTMDIWLFLRPKAKEREVVIVGRAFGIAMIGLSIGWLPIMQVAQGAQLWDYFQAISAYITPPWAVVFLMGMFWKRTTEQGAFWGLMAGLVTGVCRMGIHFSYDIPACGDPSKVDLRPDILTRVHYLHFALILSGVTFIVTFVISLLTLPRQQEQLRRVTWWTRKVPDDPELTDDDDDPDTIMEHLKDQSNSYVPPEQLSWMRNCYNAACGFNEPPPPRITKDQILEMRIEARNIREDPFWERVCDVNAIIVLALTCLVIGFFA